MTKPLSGMYAALMTALSDAGEFDPKRQRTLNKYVLSQGLSGLYVGGSSGESGLLSVDELIAQQAIVAEDAKGTGATLIAHVGVPNTRDSIRLARHAKTLGYQGLSALPPHAYPFSDEDIFGYYRDLASATDLPLIVYEIPIRTGRPLPLALLLRLFDLPNVAGIKYTSTDMFKYSILQKRRPEKTYFYGFDEIFAAAAALGADGGIGTTYNILGRLYVALAQAVTENDFRRARELQSISQDFIEPLLDVGVLPGMKAAFRAIGIECGATRPPMTMAAANGDARMAEVINRTPIRDWLAIS